MPYSYIISLNDTLYIGIDDTDSPKGMCTTFLAYKIVCKLKQDVEFLDFPRLIRFNPNVPWKTRGNGAVSLKIQSSNLDKVKSEIKDMVYRYSDIQNGANPGLVFVDKISDSFIQFSNLALWQLISRKTAKRFAKDNIQDFSYYGNGQGLVGAIGSIGYQFHDHTFELLCYRNKSNFGKKRQLSISDTQFLNKNTFNSFDEKRRIIITPHGPDPVFCGIRGENTNSLIQSITTLQTNEKLDGYMVFKSNQGTGDHLQNTLNHTNMKPFTSGIITGIVKDAPKITKGGHVFFNISFDDDEFYCAVYQPTGISSVALSLIPGDKICIGGGIRRASKNFPRVFNIEFIKILNLQNHSILSNPICENCSKSMKSKGVGQGYQCIRCKTKSSKKQIRHIPRKIKKELYLPVISAHRHLTRPIKRIKTRNLESNFNNKWIYRYSGE